MNLKGKPLKTQSSRIIRGKFPITKYYKEIYPYNFQMHRDYKQHRISELSSNE